MHPRNKYLHNPPDFQELAMKYAEFRKFCKLNVGGKVILDFKDAEAIRNLTTVLLKNDFDLNVEIPPNCLVPRVPVRLNYILWLEDLINLNHLFGYKDRSEILGLDIGTGASCIYPLLGYKQCGWSFIATDKDQSSVDYATKNVKNNDLLDKITVVKVNENTALLGVLDEHLLKNRKIIDFCMCNPPFFDSGSIKNGDKSGEIDDNDSKSVSIESESECDFLMTVSPSITPIPDGSGDANFGAPAGNRRCKRPEPHSVTVAKSTEIYYDGGELNFVLKIIEDSIKLKDKIRIFTSMLGKKSSLKPLKEKLQSINVAEMATTTFCQGKTQRWALAWTFDLNIQLKLKQEKPLKNTPVYKICLSTLHVNSGDSTSFETALKWTLNVFDTLKIDYEASKTCKESDLFRFSRFLATANRNTWTHQRRKRRANRETAAVGPKAPKLSSLNGDSLNHSAEISKKSDQNNQNSTTKMDLHEFNLNFCEINPPLKFEFTVKQWEKDIFVEFSFLSGQNIDHLHQIVQYFRNLLK